MGFRALIQATIVKLKLEVHPQYKPTLKSEEQNYITFQKNRQNEHFNNNPQEFQAFKTH